MVKHFKQLALKGEHKGIFDIYKSDVMNLALETKNYQITKLLFNKKLKYKYEHVEGLLLTCAQSKEEYDSGDQRRCKNFHFFETILRTQPINDDCDIKDVVEAVIKGERVDYLDCLFDMTEADVYASDVYPLVGSYPNAKIARFLMNISDYRLSFSYLDPDELFDMFETLCSNTYSNQSEMYKCFEMFIDQKPTVEALHKGDNGIKILVNLIEAKKQTCIEHLFQMSRKNKWNIDFSKPMKRDDREEYDGYNVLMIAVINGAFEIVQLLEETKWFDINYSDKKGKQNALLLCADSEDGYDKKDTLECDNFKIFSMLLEISGIDIKAVNSNGDNVVAICHKKGKHKFIDYLKSKVSESGNENNFDSGSISRQIMQYSISNAIVHAAASSNYQKLDKILELKQVKRVMSEIVNTNVIAESILTCGKSKIGYDENEADCDNNKTFKILISLIKKYGSKKDDGSNSIDLASYDREEEMNVWHFICKYGKVKQLDSLLSICNEKERKKYLSMPMLSEFNDRRMCFHLCVEFKQMKMIQKLLEMAKDSDVVDVDCHDSEGETPLGIAIKSIKSYPIMKLLFDPSRDNSKCINDMIELCLNSKEGFNKDDVQHCDNFILFKRLLRQSGVNGKSAFGACMKADRVEYFEYLLSNITMFEDESLTAKKLWETIAGASGHSFDIFCALLNTKEKGFEFNLIEDKDTYFDMLVNVCGSVDDDDNDDDNDAEKDKKQTRKNNALRCFELLLSQKEVQAILEKSNSKAQELLSELIGKNMELFIDHFFTTMNDLEWSMDFTRNSNGYQWNPLVDAVQIESSEVLSVLLDSELFDVNYGSEKERVHKTRHYWDDTPDSDDDADEEDEQMDMETLYPILQCAVTKEGYSEDIVDNSNFINFKTLIQSKGIDLTVKDRRGRGLIELLQKKGKTTFIDHLKEKLNNNQLQLHSNCSKLNASIVDKTEKQYQLVSQLVTASESSYKEKIEQIFLECKENDIAADSIVNRKDLKTKTTSLIACAKTTVDFNSKNEADCGNFACFKLLVSKLKGQRRNLDNFDLSIKDPAQMTVWHYICKSGKTEQFQHLVNCGHSRDKIQKYFSTLGGKEYGERDCSCLHLATSNSHMAILRKFAELANSSKYRGAIDLNIKNGSNESPLRSARWIDRKKRLEMASLFLGKTNKSNGLIDNTIINMLIDAAEHDDDSDDGWADSDEDNYNNRIVLSKTEKISGMALFKSFCFSNGIDSEEMMRYVFEQQNMAVFEYLMENGNKFSKPITSDRFWRIVLISQANGDYYRGNLPGDVEINKKAIEFAPIGKDNTFLNIMWLEAIAKSSDDLLTWVLPMESTRNILVNHPGKAGDLLKIMIKNTNSESVKKFLNKTDKSKLNLDFTHLKHGESWNPLIAAILAPSSWSDVFSPIFKSGKIDVNFIGAAQERPPILECSRTMVSYEADKPQSCFNFRFFKQLLDDKTVDVNAVDKYGNNSIGYLVMRGKHSYIDYLKQRVSNKPNKPKVKGGDGDGDDDADNNDETIGGTKDSDVGDIDAIDDIMDSDKEDGDDADADDENDDDDVAVKSGNDNQLECKLDEILIDEQVSRYKLLESIMNALKSSDNKLLEKIVKDTPEEEISKVINMVYVWREESDRHIREDDDSIATPLIRCVQVEEGYNEHQQRNNNNFECFKLLLSIPSIDPNVTAYESSAVSECIAQNKIEYLKYLLDMSKEKKWDIDVFAPIYYKERYYDPEMMNPLKFCVHNGKWKMFQILWNLLQEKTVVKPNVNELLLECARTREGYSNDNFNNCDNFSIFKVLVDHKSIDINYVSFANGKSKRTLLTELAAVSKHKYIKFLFDKCDELGWKIDFSKHVVDGTEFPQSLIEKCSRSLNTMKVVLKRHPKYDFNRRFGKRNISLALENSGLDLFKFIRKQQDIDLNVTDSRGFGLLQTIIEGTRHGASSSNKKLNYLIENNILDAKVVEKERQAWKMNQKLSKACENSSLEKIKKILKEASSKKVDIGKYIGLSIDKVCRSRNGVNEAYQKGCENYKCFVTLLNYKNIKLTHGFGILVACLDRNKYDYGEYLIDNNKKLGLNIDFSRERTYDNGNALMCIDYKEKNHKFFEKLLNLGIFNVNHIADNGRGSILDNAFQKAHDDEDKMMAEHPLQSDLYQFMKLVLSNKTAKFNTHTVNNVGNNLLVSIVRYTKSDDFLKYVIEHSWSKDEVGSFIGCNNKNLLYIAAEYGNYQCLKYLLQLNVFKNINFQGGIDNDTIINACVNGGKDSLSYSYLQCIELLLSQTDINPRIRNTYGYNAFDICKRRNRQRYLTLLNKWQSTHK